MAHYVNTSSTDDINETHVYYTAPKKETKEIDTPASNSNNEIINSAVKSLTVLLQIYARSLNRDYHIDVVCVNKNDTLVTKREVIVVDFIITFDNIKIDISLGRVLKNNPFGLDTSVFILETFQGKPKKTQSANKEIFLSLIVNKLFDIIKGDTDNDG